jgi:hypothetical protein
MTMIKWLPIVSVLAVCVPGSFSFVVNQFSAQSFQFYTMDRSLSRQVTFLCSNFRDRPKLLTLGGSVVNASEGAQPPHSVWVFSTQSLVAQILVAVPILPGDLHIPIHPAFALHDTPHPPPLSPISPPRNQAILVSAYQYAQS